MGKDRVGGHEATAGDARYFGAEDGRGPISRRLAAVGLILGIAAGRSGKLSETGVYRSAQLKTTMS